MGNILEYNCADGWVRVVFKLEHSHCQLGATDSSKRVSVEHPSTVVEHILCIIVIIKKMKLFSLSSQALVLCHKCMFHYYCNTHKLIFYFNLFLDLFTSNAFIIYFFNLSLIRCYRKCWVEIGYSLSSSRWISVSILDVIFGANICDY